MKPDPHSCLKSWRKCGVACFAAVAVLLHASCAFAFAAAVNPLLTLFPGDLVFLQTFDDGSLLPQVGAPAKSWREPPAEFAADGVIGQCLAAGGARFSEDAFGAPILDTTGSGTVVCWVRYVDEVAPGAEPPIFFFTAQLAQTPKPGRLLCFKQRRDPDMVAMYECHTDRRIAAGARIKSSYRDWPRGEWRMVAMSWTPERIGISVGGSPFTEVPYDRALGRASSFSFAAPPPSDKKRFYQIDECAILSRKLTDAEIAAVHAAFGERKK